MSRASDDERDDPPKEPAAGDGPRGARFETNFPAFALAWSSRHQDGKLQHRFAVGSVLEEVNNKVQLVDVDFDKGGEATFEVRAELEHPFPPTKLQFVPSTSGPDLLASSGNTLRLWTLDPQPGAAACRPLLTLTNWRNQHQQTPPPLTSFDWSTVTPSKIATSSVDTTITIWNVEREKAETQLIAHDKVVYDIAFDPGGVTDHLFASVGGDGSARLFDQRNLDHSTIVYETQAISPLLRLAWSKQQPNHIATMYLDKPGVVVLDIRKPSVAYSELFHADACVNSIAWAPHEAGKLLAGCDDGSACIWDVNKQAQVDKPASGGRDYRDEQRAACRPLKMAGTGEEHVQQVLWPPQFADVGVVLGSSTSVCFVDDP